MQYGKSSPYSHQLPHEATKNVKQQNHSVLVCRFSGFSNNRLVLTITNTSRSLGGRHRRHRGYSSHSCDLKDSTLKRDQLFRLSVPAKRYQDWRLTVVIDDTSGNFLSRGTGEGDKPGEPLNSINRLDTPDLSEGELAGIARRERGFTCSLTQVLPLLEVSLLA